MRLLFVSQDFPPDVGGIQTYSWEIGRRLARRPGETVFLAPRRPGCDVVDRELDGPVYRLSVRPDLLPVAALASLPRIARRHRIEASFHAQWQTAGAALLSRRLTGYPKRIAVAAHGRELLFNPFGGGLAGRGYDALRGLVLENVDLFLPVSHYTAGLLSPWRREQDVRVVHNGTDPERFHPVNGQAFRERIGAGDRPLMLFVGRVVERKGIDTALAALERLRRAIPDVLFAIAGDGPARPRLESIVSAHDLGNNVRFVGTIPYETLSQVYSAADLFVMPSNDSEPDVEGFGIVFLEANSCGCPVVGARSGGIPDAIVDGKTGLLVDPGDAHQLADALQRLLADRALSERMGQQGRERVLRDFTWDHVADRIAEALAGLK